MKTLSAIQTEVRRYVASIALAATSAVAVLLLIIGTAQVANAAWVSPTRAGEHKPKSFICSVFNICKTTGHYYCGDPNIAYTKPPPCRFLHNDRY